MRGRVKRFRAKRRFFAIFITKASVREDKMPIRPHGRFTNRPFFERNATAYPKPSPVGEGGSRRLTDEVSRTKCRTVSAGRRGRRPLRRIRKSHPMPRNERYTELFQRVAEGVDPYGESANRIQCRATDEKRRRFDGGTKAPPYDICVKSHPMPCNKKRTG